MIEYAILLSLMGGMSVHMVAEFGSHTRNHLNRTDAYISKSINDAKSENQ